MNLGELSLDRVRYKMNTLHENMCPEVGLK